MVITESDSNILFDVLTGVPPFAALSFNALCRAADEGKVIISTIGYAELAGSFGSPDEFKKFVRDLGIVLVDVDEQAAFLAGQFYKEYRARGGTRARILPDFLIAAHAQIHADRILTRDHRFFGGSFPGLKAVAPEDLQPIIAPYPASLLVRAVY